MHFSLFSRFRLDYPAIRMMKQKTKRSDRELQRRINASLQVARLLKSAPIDVIVSKTQRHEWLAAQRALMKKMLAVRWEKGNVVAFRPVSITERRVEVRGFRCASCGRWQRRGSLVRFRRAGFYSQVKVCKTKVCQEKGREGKIKWLSPRLFKVSEPST